MSRGRASPTLLNQSTGVGSQTIVDVLGALTVAEKHQVGTILRTIYRFSLRHSVAGSRVAVRFGGIKVSDDALAAGAVPDPFGDLEAGWMYNEWVFQEQADNNTISIERDIKAKRRLQGLAETIAFVLDNDPGSAAGSAIWSIGLRTLFSIR